MGRFLFVLALVLFIKTSYATNYYFSSNSGDDGRTEKDAQNPSTPWKTIDKLNSLMSKIKPGDHILFKRGETFYGSIVVLKSGSEGQPIVFSAFGHGEKPVISGLAAFENWTATEGHKGVYESTNALLDKNVNILLINNVLQQFGRYPNADSP